MNNNEIIEKLKQRNERLLLFLTDSELLEMEEAINNNYVDKFYYESRI